MNFRPSQFPETPVRSQSEAQQREMAAFSQFQIAMRQLQRTKSCTPDAGVSPDLVSRLAALNSTELSSRRSTLERSNSQGSQLCSICGAEYPNIQALQGHQVLVHKPGIDDVTVISKRQRIASEDPLVQRACHMAVYNDLVRAQEANSKPRNTNQLADVTRKLLGSGRPIRHNRTSSLPLLDSVPPSVRTRDPPILNQQQLAEIIQRSAALDSPTSSNIESPTASTTPLRRLTNSIGSQDIASLLGSPGVNNSERNDKLSSLPSDLIYQMQRLTAQSTPEHKSHGYGSAPLSRLVSQTSTELNPMTEVVSRSSSIPKTNPPPELAAAAEAWLAAQTRSTSKSTEDLDLTLHL